MKHKKPKHKRGKHYPEPGKWVNDHEHGLPDTSESITIPKEQQLTAEEVRDTIAYEGLGYCIYGIIRPNCISDSQLRKLWLQARASLYNVITYLETIPEQRKTTKKKRLHITTRTPTQSSKAVDIGDDLV